MEDCDSIYGNLKWIKGPFYNQVLLNEVLPTYYENKKKWEQMMKSSIEMSQQNFSASRMLEEYYKLMYTEE